MALTGCAASVGAAIRASKGEAHAFENFQMDAGGSSALLAGPALALTLGFDGTGTVSPTGGPDSAGNLPLIATGSYSFNGIPGWALTSPFSFNPVSGTGAGTFDFSNGSDSLFGSLTTAATVTGFALQYSVLGGTGAFLGAHGLGQFVGLLARGSEQSADTVPRDWILELFPSPARWCCSVSVSWAWDSAADAEQLRAALNPARGAGDARGCPLLRQAQLPRLTTSDDSMSSSSSAIEACRTTEGVQSRSFAVLEQQRRIDLLHVDLAHGPAAEAPLADLLED